MLTINKITSASPVDYAAEELKKYLRMMMPECGDIKISYAPDAKDGFRLGLMQDFGLDVSDAEDPELDDILYINCDTEGGIIAGSNPRSVLLSVYEYLRQNGCRWLMPGVDGEYIPMQNIKPVEYRFKPSMRYRGWCNEGAEFQQSMMDSIDFAPKVGLNVFMLEFRIPVGYYRQCYNHNHNTENRKPEPVSNRQILQWKRQCETEIAKRGLQFHDIGHGWTADPFGIDSSARSADGDNDHIIPAESRKYVAMINGERKLYRNVPNWTNFCMSNPEAQKLFAKCVADYAENHSNEDYLHVWLADLHNNHCECEECQKMTPSDWYVILLNMVDEELTRRNLSTRIVFIVYVDTSWAPITEKLINQDRFTMLLAPISRSYTMTLPEWGVKAETVPYVRNKLTLPKDLEEYFAYLADWKKMWHGSCMCYEYHFWWHQCMDVSGFELAKRINEDIKVYKEYGINGIIEDGSQRSFYPTGYHFYTYARTLFDSSLSCEEIAEDYFSHAFGKDWKKFIDYLTELGEAIDYYYLHEKRSADMKVSPFYNPEQAKKLDRVPEIIEIGRKLIEENYNSDYRVQTVSVRLLEKHANHAEILGAALAKKARGMDDEASELYEKYRLLSGKDEVEIGTYFDHTLYMNHISRIFKTKSNLSGPIIESVV